MLLRSEAFNEQADEGIGYENVGEFPIMHDCQAWFVEYLKELGFSNSGRPLNKQVEKLWREKDKAYRTEDNRLLIRPNNKDAGVGTSIPNFMNITNNFQLYWHKYALKKATSNINVLSFDHFFELVTYPSRDYHDPLKVNEIFAPTAYNY